MRTLQSLRSIRTGTPPPSPARARKKTAWFLWASATFTAIQKSRFTWTKGNRPVSGRQGDNGKIQFNGPRAFKALSLQNHLGSVDMASVKADSVYIKLDNGDLDVSDVESKSFTVENHLGKIKAANIRADEGSIKNDNGKITLTDSTYTMLTAEDHLGDIIGEGLNIKGGQFKNDNGKISLSGAIEGAINVTAHLGDVNIKTSIP